MKILIIFFTFIFCFYYSQNLQADFKFSKKKTNPNNKEKDNKPEEKIGNNKKKEEDDFDEFDLREQMLLEEDVVHMTIIRIPDKNKIPKELKDIKKIVVLPITSGLDSKIGKDGFDLSKASSDQVFNELVRQLKLGGKYEISTQSEIANDTTAFIFGTVWADYTIQQKNNVYIK